jgi:hypothetical protein
MVFRVITSTSCSNATGAMITLDEIRDDIQYHFPELSSSYFEYVSYENGILRLLNSHITLVCKLIN